MTDHKNRRATTSPLTRRRLDLEGALRERFLEFLDLCRGELADIRAKEDVNADIKRVASLLKDANQSDSRTRD